MVIEPPFDKHRWVKSLAKHLDRYRLWPSPGRAAKIMTCKWLGRIGHLKSSKPWSNFQSPTCGALLRPSFCRCSNDIYSKGWSGYGDGTFWDSQNSPLFYQALLFNLSPRSDLNVGYDLSKWKLRNNMKEPNKTSKWWFKNGHHPSLSRFIRFLEPQAGTPQETRPTRLDFFASDEEDEDAWCRDGPRWWPPQGYQRSQGEKNKT